MSEKSTKPRRAKTATSRRNQRPKRADAQRNVARLLEVALEVFTSSGVDAPVREIAEAVKGADRLYLATDPDREGEAISWHVLEVLKGKKVGIIGFSAGGHLASTAATHFTPETRPDFVRHLRFLRRTALWCINDLTQSHTSGLNHRLTLEAFLDSLRRIHLWSNELMCCAA